MFTKFYDRNFKDIEKEADKKLSSKEKRTSLCEIHAIGINFIAKISFFKKFNIENLLE